MQTNLQEDVLFSCSDDIGFIELNRPKSLNALNPGMMTAIAQKLVDWKEDDSIQAVVVRSRLERAFCAGGDLRAVYEAGIQGHLEDLEHLFREEYILNYIIKTYPKPYIAFVDGIAMGGGLGLSVHGSHRLLSEKVLIAMPETKIGYFPDVGATFFLNQAPGKIGLYLALTGNQMNLSDALYARIGTHYISHDRQSAVLKALKLLPKKNHAAIDGLLTREKNFPPSGLLTQRETEINALFSAPTLQGVFNQLEANSGEFAKETLEILKQRSPMSLAVTFEQMKRGKGIENFADVMSMEFDMSQKFVKEQDFFEGIRSVIIDKDCKPNWFPKSLREITTQQVEAYFVKQEIPLDFYAYSRKELDVTALL